MSSSYSKVGTRTGSEDQSLEDHRTESTSAGDSRRHRIDTNAARWVLAATVAFWLAVFAAGSSLL